MGRACAWKTRWYKGLNSHSPLAEDVSGIELSQEELLERMIQKKERDRLRARAFYHSEVGQLYHQAYRNTAERKAYMRNYHQSPENKRRKLASPRYAKQLQERKDGRALVKKFEAKKLPKDDVIVIDDTDDADNVDDTEDDDDIDQELLGKALKLKASKTRTREKYKDRDADERRASLEVLNQVKAGKLDGEDPAIAKQTKVAAGRIASSKKYKSTHRVSVNATKRARYAASVEALEKVDKGLLDGNDPEVKKLCKVAQSARDRARKNLK